MDTRKTIFVYQYSERIKSEIIIASELLAKMSGFSRDEFAGAERLMRAYLEAVVREIRIAQNIERSMNFLGAERKVMEAIGKMKPFEYSEANGCLSEALSLITTSCQAYMEALAHEGLI